LDFSVGHHSTSDDSFAYRARAEVEDRKRIDNPITRFQLFMKSNGWWNADDEAELKARLKADVMKAFKRTDSLKRCELGELFTDVYGGQVPLNIVSHIVLCEFLSLAILMANRGNNEMNSRDS
jgi:2-oxoisovalerate dehydrogenase E1 component alpha subunit